MYCSITHYNWFLPKKKAEVVCLKGKSLRDDYDDRINVVGDIEGV